MPHATDLELSAADLARLTSADALAALLDRLGYDTASRAPLSAEAIGYGDAEDAIRHIELLATDGEDFLRVLFVHVRSITAKVRNGLTRTLGRRSEDYLLILTADFEQFELVLIDKLRHRRAGPGGQTTFKPVARSLGFNRREAGRLTLRILRGLTFTASDGLFQYDKLRHAFEAARYSGRYFQNRALFSDHYLETRLPELPPWRDSPAEAFQRTRDLLDGAHQRLLGEDEKTIRRQLYEPLFEVLGFKARPGRPRRGDAPTPDYLLSAADGDGRQTLTAALVYRWDRWLDGPGHQSDPDAPDENPGAAVVTLLEEGVADWIIVTNGRLWRLYSARAHSRSTNFYEVDLEEALLQAGDTDPNEAFRYWWLLFRRQAFQPHQAEGTETWLDFIAAESTAYARRVEDRLKGRVFEQVVPQLAAGFLADRRHRLGHRKPPTEAELEDIRQATLTLLYRILFLLYAEARDLLPVRESPYAAISLARIKQQIADAAGAAESDADQKLTAAFKTRSCDLYDRLLHLFAIMDRGDAAVNVPQYNGRLFWMHPPDPQQEAGSSREAAIARLLNQHKVPDRHLALAIDRLARVPDDKTFALVFVDYKSMGVRQLGSIYEGLLEYRLALAGDDLTTEKAKGRERYIPLSQVRGGGARRGGAIVVHKGEPYLTTDNAERKATGSYYTPDHIVAYIVEHTVGPVLDGRLEALRPAFRRAEKTWHTAFNNARADPGITRSGLGGAPRDAAEYAQQQTFDRHRDLAEQLFALRVLDPAMGSGHFLVEAVDFITDRLIDFLNRFPHNPIHTALERTRRDILDACNEQGVSIDPFDDRLNDVHLLKRHVLKRCIFGVDLNPLACELAKVSLWLDAFTLGAPLSFLDHHLRPGNSLVGSWFDDLERATEGQLFGIDYEPLKRAMRNVLRISRLSDATAAEARQSAAGYLEARRQLDTYRILFDLLTAEYFGHPRAPQMLSHATEIDFTSHPRFMASLSAADRDLVAAVEQVAAERRFLHWELEFPEVFFQLSSGVGLSGRQATEHLEPRPADQRGFDAIVGNPPYVRQETIKDGKPFFKAHYADTFVPTADIYVLFIEREVELLCSGGRMGMIVANKWLRSNYGQRLRRFLQRHTRPVSMLDFGHTRIFPDADTFPMVPIVERRPRPLEDEPPDDEAAIVVTMPRADYRPDLPLGPYVARHRKDLPTRLLRCEGWSLEDPGIQRIMEKMRQRGVPLKDYCGCVPIRGIVSGLNDAFYIDGPTRAKLLARDPRSAEIIKPLIRGRDIDRWRVRDTDTYLIFTRRGIDIDQYPAVRDHLLPFRAQLQKRAGGQAWFELQGSPGPEFAHLIEKPKIVYQEIQYHAWFALDTSGAAMNNKVFYIPRDDHVLLGILASATMWGYLTRTLPHMKDEALHPAGFMMEQVPIAECEAALGEQIGSTVEALIDTARRVHEAESTESIADGRPAPPALLTSLQRQLELETHLSALVEQAYGLTDEERTLWRTHPVLRDPVAVLGRRIEALARFADNTPL